MHLPQIVPLRETKVELLSKILLMVRFSISAR